MDRRYTCGSYRWGVVWQTYFCVVRMKRSFFLSTFYFQIHERMQKGENEQVFFNTTVWWITLFVFMILFAWTQTDAKTLNWVSFFYIFICDKSLWSFSVLFNKTVAGLLLIYFARPHRLRTCAKSQLTRLRSEPTNQLGCLIKMIKTGQRSQTLELDIVESEVAINSLFRFMILFV